MTTICKICAERERDIRSLYCIQCATTIATVEDIHGLKDSITKCLYRYYERERERKEQTKYILENTREVLDSL